MSDERAERLRCDWCGSLFRPPKATGRVPRYCRRSCRQRAYEARKVREAVEAAVTAVGRQEGPAVPQATAEPLPPVAPDSSRDETVGGGDFLLAPPGGTAVPEPGPAPVAAAAVPRSAVPPRRPAIPLPPPGPRTRRPQLLPAPPQSTLFGREDVDGQ